MKRNSLMFALLLGLGSVLVSPAHAESVGEKIENLGKKAQKGANKVVDKTTKALRRAGKKTAKAVDTAGNKTSKSLQKATR